MRRVGVCVRQAAGIVWAQLEAEADRWFLWVPVLFGAGIGAYFALTLEPGLVVTMAAAAAALLVRIAWRNGAAALVVGGALAAILAGFAAAKLRSVIVDAPVLARSTGPVGVSGWVELVEPRPERGERLTLRVQAIDGLPPETWPARVRVRTLTPLADLKPGDAVRVRATLSPPPGPALPGGFDFARQAYFLQLGAVGYAREAPQRVTLPPPPLHLRVRAPIERLRQRIGARIRAALPGETGAIAVALITGERGAISEATNAAYRDSGLIHILSISGLHMVIMGGAVFVAVRFLLSLVPLLALNYPIKKWAATAAAAGALAYLLISGSSAPTVRSYIMITIMYLAVLLDRPAVALRNVALAALLILALYPESLIDVSFQMSFAAVVALVSVYEALRDREEAAAAAGEGAQGGFGRTVLRFAAGIILSTLIASLAVAPFGLYHFQKSQQYAMLGNLIAIPICNTIVMPMALASLVAMPLGLEAWPLKAMGLGIDAMTWCAWAVASLPGAVIRVPAIPEAAFMILVAGGLWACLWRRRWRYLGLIPVLAGIGLATTRTAPDILVGRDGASVATRGTDGRLMVLAERQGKFEVSRWLEHDGDGRPVEAVLQAGGYVCDWAGCTVRVRGRRVAIARSPAAVADDCGAADVLIAPRLTVPAGACAPGRPVVDARALAQRGAHALFVDDLGRIAVVTVADRRGIRPWSAMGAVGGPGIARGASPPLPLSSSTPTPTPAQVPTRAAQPGPAADEP